MYSWLFHATARGAEIVTVNKRLARELRHAHDARQLENGLRSWPTPRILPWNAWLASLLERHDAAPFRVGPVAAALVWERLLRERAGDRILNPEGLVSQVRQSWQRFHDWRGTLADLERYASNEDERMFAALASSYQRELDARSWIDHAQVPARVADLVDAGKIAVPPLVIYAGFDRLVPAAEQILQAIERRGAKVEEAPRPQLPATIRVVPSPDADAELRAAGLWARRLLERRPDARIAIVCPGLEGNAPRSARLVREGLAPGWQCAGGEADTAVNVSYGRRMAEYPLVSAALLWLRWACHGLRTREVSVLLRTPFAGRGSMDARARLELALRRFPERNWRPAGLSAALEGTEGADPAWLERVQLVGRMEARRNLQESPAAWAASIDELLQNLGWPGERTLDSSEFQVANRWRELLNELSRLDIVQPRMALGEAVHRLATLAAETLFQPESEPGAVQLMGPLEAAGLEFDHLRVCHLESLRWPPQADPLPLVSRGLQRKLGMPDATPADTLDFSRRILGRLAGSAPEVTLSWPMVQQDVELEPSPLLAPYADGTGEREEDPGWFAEGLSSTDATRTVTSDPAPALRPGEKVGGGVATLQWQAVDPFSAFARGRLGAAELRAIEPGLNPGMRGTIIHRALSHLFREHPSLRDIAAWAGEDLRLRIEQAIDAAFASPQRSADGVLLRLLAIERARLRSLLRQFLEAEKERRPFEVVQVEQKVLLRRHGIDLELRVDRIDRLADGSLLIVDYKTGAPKVLLRREDEPKELQLVAYAMALENSGSPIGGLVLINVDSRDVGYRGAGGSVEWDKTPPELWSGRLDSWKRIADEALAQLAAGDVRLGAATRPVGRSPLHVLSRAVELERGR